MPTPSFFDVDPTISVGTGGTPFVNVTVTFNQGELGTYNLMLEQTESQYAPTEPPSTLVSFNNTFTNGFATLATITAVPEASAFLFGGAATSVAGVVAWRRRTRVA